MKRLTAKREKEIRYGRDFNVQQLAEILEELDATRADLRKAQGKPGTPVMKVDADAQSKLLRRLGRKHKIETIFEISFALYTPDDYCDPAQDQILLFDLLDTISKHVMEFHDIPGFKLGQVLINREEVIG